MPCSTFIHIMMITTVICASLSDILHPICTLQHRFCQMPEQVPVMLRGFLSICSGILSQYPWIVYSVILCTFPLKNLESSEKTPPSSLVLSLLEKTRAAFCLSPKCLLNSTAHTCLHRMQGALGPGVLCGGCGSSSIRQTVTCSFLCLCEKKDKALWTCASPAEDRVTPYRHMSSTPSFYIHNRVSPPLSHKNISHFVSS